MFGLHRGDGFRRIKVQTLREQGFGCLTVLPLLGKRPSPTSIVGSLGGGGGASSLRFASCLLPQVFKAAFLKRLNPIFDGGSFGCKSFLPRGKEEDEFG